MPWIDKDFHINPPMIKNRTSISTSSTMVAFAKELKYEIDLAILIIPKKFSF